ncbi:MAG: choice-of-anchor B family protein [Lewinella sp.]|nr:choice-of-anchor B family protein [Lewinella sp.]
MNKLGQWDDNSLVVHNGIQYNDVWGYAAAGREYALLGSAQFVHVLDVTTPSSIVEITRLNTLGSSNSIWRDIKIYGQYAYCVADQQAEGLQIIDLSNLPSSASIVNRTTAFFTRAHNIFIDESNQRLYALGIGSSITILSLAADPLNPSLLATVNLPGGYVHDAYARGNRLYANHGNSGLYVYDVSNPAAPQELGRLTAYSEAGYNHSCWLSPNGNYLVFCDETSNRGVKLADVSDPANITVTDVFRSALLAPAHTNSIAHNPYILDDSLLVISYYDDGVQVWNYQDPSDVRRRAYYDTYPQNTTYGNANGAWGAYPWLPSGNILGSDILNGLFVLNYQTAALPVAYEQWNATARGAQAHLTWTTASEQDNLGFSVEHSTDGRAYATLGWVAAKPVGETYHFLHTVGQGGIQYYRLRQRDVDGTEALSELRSLVFTKPDELSYPWPNPAQRGSTVSLPNAGPWRLVSLDGRLLVSTEQSKLALPSDLPIGNYRLYQSQNESYPLQVTE